MPVYFAYGSNMSGARLLARVGAARSLGAVHVRDWTLAFNKPGRDGTGKANLVPCAGARAWGVAWELADAHWQVLDRYERDYERALFRLETPAGAPLEAAAYLFAAAADAPAIPPSPEYVAHLLAGAAEHALPDAWLERIRSLARRSLTQDGVLGRQATTQRSPDRS